MNEDAKGHQVSARPNTGPQDRTTSARCRVLLAEGKLTVQEIATRLGKYPHYVYNIKWYDEHPIQRAAARHKRPTNRMHKRHVTADQDSRKGLPTCQWCGLLAPCTCTGPMRAADFVGRAGESRCSMQLPRPF